jgi:hypothetical protein
LPLLNKRQRAVSISIVIFSAAEIRSITPTVHYFPEPQPCSNQKEVLSGLNAPYIVDLIWRQSHDLVDEHFSTSARNNRAEMLTGSIDMPNAEADCALSTTV